MMSEYNHECYDCGRELANGEQYICNDCYEASLIENGNEEDEDESF